MILQNNSACLIAINTSPILSAKQISDLREKNRPIPSSFENIPPQESRDVDDKYCDCDFVKNLIEIGDLIVLDSPAAQTKNTKQPESNKKEPKESKEDFMQAMDDAEIDGIDVSGCKTIKDIEKARKRAHKKK